MSIFLNLVSLSSLGTLLRADYLRPVRLTTRLRPPSESHMRQGAVQQSEWAHAAGFWFVGLIALSSPRRDFGKYRPGLTVHSIAPERAQTPRRLKWTHRNIPKDQK